MPTIDQIAEQQDALLARFAEQAAELAGALHARAMAAADDGAMCDLSLAFQRTGRAMRQSLALRLKLRREALEGGREDDVRARREGMRRNVRRAADLESRMVEEITEATEDEDVRERLFDDLNEAIFEDTIKAGYAGQDIEAQLSSLRRRLKLEAVRAGIELEPEPEPDPPEPEPRRDPPRTAHASQYDYLGDERPRPWRSSG